jgi:hypothetical protein
MIAHGRVQNGVIILDEGVFLPEGQEVTVIAPVDGTDSGTGRQRHGLLDSPTVSLESILQPLGSDDDLLGEMLQGRS